VIQKGPLIFVCKVEIWLVPRNPNNLGVPCSPSKLPWRAAWRSRRPWVSNEGSKTNTPLLKQSGHPGSGAADSSARSNSSSTLPRTWGHGTKATRPQDAREPVSCRVHMGVPPFFFCKNLRHRVLFFQTVILCLESGVHK
jgi:hypothetical protein